MQKSKTFLGQTVTAVIGVVSLAALSGAVQAATELGDSGILFSGFISQAAIHTSDNNYFGESDDGLSLDYRELGALFTARPLSQLGLSAQILSRKAGENDDGSVALDHFVINYDLIDEEDWSLGIRAGRLKSTLGWYNETRDVPFTRPSIFLSQSVYVDRVRNTFFFQDGIHLRGDIRQDDSLWSWHVGYHKPRVDDDEISDVAPFPQGTAKVSDMEGDDSYSGSLIFDQDDGRLRLGVFIEDKNIKAPVDGSFTIANPCFGNPAGLGGYCSDDMDGPEGPIPPPHLIPAVPVSLQNIDLRNRKVVLSAEYNLERWSFAAERVRSLIEVDITSDDPTVAAFLEDPRMTSVGYYYQITNRLTNKIDVFARRDVLYFDDDAKDGRVEPQMFFLANGVPPSLYYSKDNTLGLGWHFDTDWLLRAEWHNVEGVAWVNTADNPVPQAAVKYWDMVAIQLSYRF